MRELLDRLDEWRAAGRAAVVARVVRVEGSGPSRPGTAMAVADDGEVAGSVSGGCVEGQVVAAALELLPTGGTRAASFGYDDDAAFAAGLTCGGTVHLFLEPVDWDRLAPVAAALRADEAVAVVTVLDSSGPGSRPWLVLGEGGAATGTLGDDDLDRAGATAAADALAAGRSEVRAIGATGVEVFIDCFTPPPRLVLCGAVEVAAALVPIAKVLGFRVAVCDARPAFATSRRFPGADAVVVDWPHRHLEALTPPLTARDAVCVLTHDAKFDVPALLVAFAGDAGYIGAMGSRRTQAERAVRLREAGATDADLARLRAPIGLDLGGRTPEETAVAIAAEIVAVRAGRAGGGALRDGTGPLHDAAKE